MDWLNRFSKILNQIFIVIAGAILTGMVILTCTNVFSSAFRMPVRGTFELMGYGGAVVTALALGYTQAKRGNIAVDILVERFPFKVRRILDVFNNGICMVFFALVAWQIFKYGTTLKMQGEITETLQIIYYPFTYCVGLGCGVLSLVFLTEGLRAIKGNREGAI